MVVLKASAGQVINANYNASLVAECVAATAGEFRSLSYAVYWSTAATVSKSTGTKITCDNTTTEKVVTSSR